MSPVRSNKVNKETHMVNIQLGTMMVVLIGYTREKKRMYVIKIAFESSFGNTISSSR